jgi:hydrogenase nickel incorporation protein HypA/HybF
MHELGLLRGVVAAVERAADRAGAVRVEAVGLRVGTLSGAVPDALLGAWPIAIANSPLRGSRLVIETVQAAVWCSVCDGEQPIDQFFALTCPACGTPTGALVRGREFEVGYADLDRAGTEPDQTGADQADPDRAEPTGPAGPGRAERTGPPEPEPTGPAGPA